MHGAPLGPGQTDRAQLRQRLPVPVHAGAARAAHGSAGSARRTSSSAACRLPKAASAQRQIRGLRAGRLGARHAGLQPRRPDHARRRGSCTTRWRPRDEVLQRRYHVPVNWFCYPSGHYDATVVAAVKAAGYAGSTTVVPGWAHPARRPLPAAPPARARRHVAEQLLSRDRRGPRRSRRARVLQRRLS